MKRKLIYPCDICYKCFHDNVDVERHIQKTHFPTLDKKLNNPETSYIQKNIVKNQSENNCDDCGVFLKRKMSLSIMREQYMKINVMYVQMILN